MALLIGAVNLKMGKDTPVMAMFAGMMPYIRTKLDEVDESSLASLANIMAQAFEKVSDPQVSESDFQEWLKFE